MPKYVMFEVPEEAEQAGFSPSDIKGAMAILAPVQGMCPVFFGGASIVQTEVKDLREVKALKVRRELPAMDVNSMINATTEVSRRFTSLEVAQQTIRQQEVMRHARQGRSPGGLVVPH